MPFPPDTTYATLAEFKQRVSAESGVNTVTDAIGLQLLNAAAWMVDGMTRDARPGYEAFSASASETRYFNDDLSASGIIEIDDCLTVTAVTRGLSTISSPFYQLWPFNPPGGPFTRLLLRADSTWPQLAVITPSSWYNYPYPGVGAGQIAITGTWGYCTANNRPPVIKEATLRLAKQLYDEGSFSTREMANSIQNPATWVDKTVLSLLSRSGLIAGQDGTGLFA